MHPSFSTDRLLIRPIVREDHPSIFAGLSHPEVIRYYGVSFESFEASKSQMDWYAKIEKEHTGIWWAIIRQTDKAFLGALGFNEWEHEHRKAEFGLWLLPQYWKQGYIQEAAPEIFRYGFKEMNLHRIEAFVESANHASQKAMQRLGFHHEGCMRDVEYKNNHFISLEIFAFFEEDQTANS